MFWAVTGLVLFITAVYLVKKQHLRWAALLVVIATVLKIFGYDMLGQPLEAWAVTLLVTGVVALSIAFWYHSSSWEKIVENLPGEDGEREG